MQIYRLHSVPQPEDYVAGLTVLGARVTDLQRRLLVAQCLAPDHTPPTPSSPTGRTHEIRFPQTITPRTHCSSNVGQARDSASPDLCHCVPLVRPANIETDTAACECRIAYDSPATPSFPDWRQFGLNTGEG